MTFHADYSDSGFVSDKYPIFQKLGYPQIDVSFFEDGSWSLLEMHNAPVIPDLTKFNWIAKNLKNVEFNEGNVMYLIRNSDPRNPEFWAKEIAKSMVLEKQHVDKQNKDQEWIEDIVPKLMQNQALMDRVARYGSRELSIDRIALAIAKQTPGLAKKLGIKVSEEHVPTGHRKQLV